MSAIISLILFMIWLLGVFGVYQMGWYAHIFLGLSIMFIFISAIRSRNPKLTEIMDDNDLHRNEAERVKEIMDRNKLSEKDAIRLAQTHLRYLHK